MSATMQGRRVECPFDTHGAVVGDWPEPGDYWRESVGGYWSGVAPSGQFASLRAHTVVQFEDGTISVSPSILVRGGGMPGEWHGYLERGAWREC